MYISNNVFSSNSYFGYLLINLTNYFLIGSLSNYKHFYLPYVGVLSLAAFEQY